MRQPHLTRLVLALVAAPQALLAQDAAQWQGFHAGLSFGYTDADETLESTRESAGGDESFGVYAGYDYAVTEQIVIGAELALYDNEVKPDTDDGGSTILENLSAINIRAGYATGTTLFYGGIGYMFSDLESTFGLVGASDGDGVSITLGVEAFVAENITLRADITRSELTGYEFTADGFEVRTTSMRLGAAYRF